MSIAKVALYVPLDTLFDYIADGLGRDQIGARVVVPFGRRQLVGVVVDVAASSTLPAGKLKSVVRVLSDIPPLPPHLMALFRFCSQYYHHPLGEIVLNALPATLRKTSAAKEKITGYQITAAGQAVDIEALPARARLKRKLLLALKQEMHSAQELAALAPGYRPILR